MDILDRVAQNHAFMLESHRAFLELIEELKDDRNLAHEASFSDYSDSDAEAADESGLLVADEEPVEGSHRGIYEDCTEDFPMTRRAFDPNTIDMEDPAFWGGKEIGIPMGLLVKSSDGQGKLLPIKNGMFVDYDGEY